MFPTTCCMSVYNLLYTLVAELGFEPRRLKGTGFKPADYTVRLHRHMFWWGVMDSNHRPQKVLVGYSHIRYHSGNTPYIYGGGYEIRTHSGIANSFTDCPNSPTLAHPHIFWYQKRDSNSHAQGHGFLDRCVYHSTILAFIFGARPQIRTETPFGTGSKPADYTIRLDGQSFFLVTPAGLEPSISTLKE